jgi:hypothetical protein
MSDLTPWLILIALGAFHGLNPAMGWFFAASLGLYRKSRRVVLISLIPIALGHAAAIGVVVFAVVGLGMAIYTDTFRIVAGVLLIVWGVYHWLYGHHHHFHIGVTTGLLGLGVWSFLMATAHGAGVMLIPVLMPLEHAHHAHQAGGHAHHMMAMDSFGLASLAVVVHSLAMLIVTGAIALLVYQSAGFEVLKRSWINLDLAWTIALIGMGAWLLFF